MAPPMNEAKFTRRGFLISVSAAGLALGSGRIALASDPLGRLRRTVIRGDDLLALTLEFNDIHFDRARLFAEGANPRVSLSFSSQAFWETKYPDGKPPPDDGDVAKLTGANASVVTFRFGPELASGFPFSLESLLHWCDRRTVGADSRFEIPYQMVLGPRSTLITHHRARPRTASERVGFTYGDPLRGPIALMGAINDTRWIDVWHTRLDDGNGAGSLKAVSTRIKLTDLLGNCTAPASECDLDGLDALALMTLTNENDIPISILGAGLVLSPSGARTNLRLLKTNRRLHPEMVSSWTYRSGSGREELHEKTYTGFLYPWGHQCTIVLSSERQFRTSSSGRRIAFLRCRIKLHADQAEIVYPDPVAEKLGFRSVTLLDQDVYVNLRPVPGVPSDAGPQCLDRKRLISFITQFDNDQTDFMLSFASNDLRPAPRTNRCKHRGRAIFISDVSYADPKHTYDEYLGWAKKALASTDDPPGAAWQSQMSAVKGQIITENGNTYINVGAGPTGLAKPAFSAARASIVRDGAATWLRYPYRNEILLNDQAVAFADAAEAVAQQTENAVVDVVGMTLDHATFVAADGIARVAPALVAANVRVQALKQILGDQAIVSVRLPQVKGAVVTASDPANIGKLALELCDSTGLNGVVYPLSFDPKTLAHDAAQGAIRTGLATFDQQIAGIALPTGLVYAAQNTRQQVLNDLHDAAQWSPTAAWADLKDNGPRILGLINLVDILKSTTESVFDAARQVKDAIPQLKRELAEALHPKYTYTYKADLKDADLAGGFLKFRAQDVTGAKGKVTFTQTVQLSVDGRQSASLECSLSGFYLELTVVQVAFSGLSFKQSDSGTDAHVGGLDVRLSGGSARVLAELAEKLTPKTGPIIALGTDFVEAGYRFPVPNAAFGAFQLRNLAISIGARLPLLRGKALEVDFAISTPQAPFTVSAGIFGGAGSFGLSIALENLPTGLMLRPRLRGTIEAGIFAGFDFLGVASGFLRIAIGLAFATGYGTGEDAFGGYFHAEGCVSVLGILSVDVCFHVGVDYHPGTDVIEATAYYQVSVSMLFFSASFRLSMSHRFPLGNDSRPDLPRGQGNTQQTVAFQAARRTRATLSADFAPGLPTVPKRPLAFSATATAAQQPRDFATTMTSTDWRRYCEAFA